MKLIASAFEVDFDFEGDVHEYIIPPKHLEVIQPASHHKKEVRRLPAKDKQWCLDNLKNFQLFIGGEGYIMRASAEDIMLAHLRFA